MCIRVLWLWQSNRGHARSVTDCSKTLRGVRIAGEQISDIIQLYNSDDILMIMIKDDDDEDR